MITDYQTNIVYLADAFKLEVPKEFKIFVAFLEDHGVKVKILHQTEDFYCRDYMPVQLDEKTFVQFVFNPKEYFKDIQFESITNPIQVGLMNKLPTPKYSKIILDGGNIVKWKDRVIITDKVYSDNLYQFKNDKKAIIKQLEEELQCPVIIIPSYPGDETGHADGLVRFVDGNHVFINEKDGDPQTEWFNKFQQILSRYELIATELPCSMEENQASGNGLYINYLHVGNLVVVPQFKLPEDKKAFQIIEAVMGKKNKVVPYNAIAISKYGGVLNCATWSIRI